MDTGTAFDTLDGLNDITGAMYGRRRGNLGFADDALFVDSCLLSYERPEPNTLFPVFYFGVSIFCKLVVFLIIGLRIDRSSSTVCILVALFSYLVLLSYGSSILTYFLVEDG